MNDSHPRPPVVVATHLVKRFGRKGGNALDGLDLEIAHGKVTVLLGRNGAGKSTLLRLAHGMLEKDAGAISVLGRDPIAATDEVRVRSGYVPDAPDVPPWMTPLEWLRFLAPHYPRFDLPAARETMAQFSVPQKTRFSELSKGQAMLALLASATAHEPELLLLDEPFGALDPIARDEVLAALIGELRYAGRAVVVTTHDLDVACRVADDIVVIDRGRVAWESRSESLVAPTPSQVRERLAATIARAAAESTASATTPGAAR
jgi:ABC-2 type transport system ATP-binding protein